MTLLTNLFWILTAFIENIRLASKVASEKHSSLFSKSDNVKKQGRSLPSEAPLFVFDNIKLSLKYLPHTNALAYFVTTAAAQPKHVDVLTTIQKDCFQNKSKFITEDHFTKHMNIIIR
jgi:hypothetical protein